MELDQQRCWLSLAQQPYPIIREFLKQIVNSNTESIADSLIDSWLETHHCVINFEQLEHSLSWLGKKGHHLLAFPQFPERLKAINDPPVILFLAGDHKLLEAQQLAIVGSRKPTSGAQENVVYFARHLAELGLIITSGMAVGIDGLAHRAALQVEGKTVAVLGCGHDTCYPYKHQSLFRDIEEKGLLISEFTPDTPVKGFQFPRRNRIISGLSLGVLVVEAAIKSGSLITCRLAAEQGREVFAIPGDIANPMSRGCHHLIRQGACLVDHPKQIIEELGYIEPSINPKTLSDTQVTSISGLSNDEIQLMHCIERHPININNLVIRSGMKMSLVLSVLFSLELKQKISGSADGYFRRKLESSLF
ncbi:MAG: DNA-protecting protein DprA [Gammaproteobacteria bacterium]|nr:DNA-protecting protein DprA [Gammaproteobacteria bacterium]